MSRVRGWRAWLLTACGCACVQALGGCEVVLGVGSLSDRSGSGSSSGAGAGVGSGASAGSGNESGSGGSGLGSGATTGASAGGSTGAVSGGSSGSGAGTGSASGNSTGGAGGSNSGTTSGSASGATSGTSPACVSTCSSGQTSCTQGGKVTCTLGGNGCWSYGAPVACQGATPVCTNGACGCSPGTTQCSDNSVATCGSNGQWGSPWPCATGSCSAGACTGSTTGMQNPSCASGGPGRASCGASSESCCTSLEVPGGTYFRTYTNSGGGPAGEADSATVSGLRVDKYLVTVGRFRQFVNAWNGGNGYTPPAGSGKHAHLDGGNGLAAIGGGSEPGWATADDSNVAPTGANLSVGTAYATWTASASSQENLPINYVNWWEAYAFCIWDGGFLPSEAEWEYVAAGGNAQREYPWGSTPPGTANQYAIYADPTFECYYPDNATCTGVTNIAPVGTATLGGGLFGPLDLVGDLSVWTIDWYGDYYPCVDCAKFTPEPPGRMVSPERVVRGSGFNTGGVGAVGLLPTGRGGGTPDSGGMTLGLRCFRSP
jgi:sulfatase modifying factor 1